MVIDGIIYHMATTQKTRKVTANLPADVLDRALAVTGKGLTPTIVLGLLELERQGHRSALRALRGRIRFDLDLGTTRK